MNTTFLDGFAYWTARTLITAAIAPASAPTFAQERLKRSNSPHARRATDPSRWMRVFFVQHSAVNRH